MSFVPHLPVTSPQSRFAPALCPTPCWLLPRRQGRAASSLHHPTVRVGAHKAFATMTHGSGSGSLIGSSASCPSYALEPCCVGLRPARVAPLIGPSNILPNVDDLPNRSPCRSQSSCHDWDPPVARHACQNFREFALWRITPEIIPTMSPITICVAHQSWWSCDWR